MWLPYRSTGGNDLSLLITILVILVIIAVALWIWRNFAGRRV
jgi:hypothetical protein